MAQSKDGSDFIIWLIMLVLSPFIALLMLGWEVFGRRSIISGER